MLLVNLNRVGTEWVSEFELLLLLFFHFSVRIKQSSPVKIIINTYVHDIVQRKLHAVDGTIELWQRTNEKERNIDCSDLVRVIVVFYWLFSNQ